MDCCAPVSAASATPVAAALLFGTGFAMSIGHCIGMCGPLVTAVSMADTDRRRKGLARVADALLYQLGRVTTYALIGGAAGLLASTTGLMGRSQTVRGGLSTLAGVLMVVAAFGLLGILPVQRWFDRSPLGGPVTRLVRSLLTAPSMWGRYALGIANGLLPCGPVAVAALSAAATFSPLRGAVAMASYGFGTLPALLVLGLGAGFFLRPAVRNRFFHVGAVMVLLIGVQLGLRGMHAFGVLGPMKLGSIVLW